MFLTLVVTFFGALAAFAHEVGIVADAMRPRLKDCRPLFRELPFPVATELIRQHFQNLFEQNQNFFKAFISGPEPFCIRSQYLSGSLKPNAYADVESGAIVFTPSFVKLLSHDSQVAAVLAHEVGHIAMYHRLDPVPYFLRTKATPEILSKLRRVHASLDQLTHERWDRQAFFSLVKAHLIEAAKNETEASKRQRNQTVLTKLAAHEKIPLRDANVASHPLVTDDALYGELLALAQEYRISQANWVRVRQEKIQTLLEQIETLEVEIKSFFGDKYKRELFAHFKEREADEVGLELYVRAGYDPEKYADGLLAVLMVGRPRIKSLEDASQFCDEQKRLGNVVEGNDTHPDLCWRVMNVAHELEVHKEYYRELQSRAKKPVFELSLKQAQATLN
ncbi:MAG: M48 family metalloprotease [Bdellovibrionales bacterium]